MGDVDGCELQALLKLADFRAYPAAKAGVEIGKRLVEKQDLRFENQRAGNRHALLLAPGQFCRKPAAHAGKADEFEPVFRPSVAHPFSKDRWIPGHTRHCV